MYKLIELIILEKQGRQYTRFVFCQSIPSQIAVFEGMK